MKLKKSIKRFLIILFILVILILLVFYFLHDEKKVKKVKVLTSIKDYGYELKDNKSKEYKELFYELQKILEKKEVNEEKYVETISKMFIIDYYSLNDKIAKTDVGGSDFVHSKALVDFLEKSQNTIYKYIESNLYGDREQNLPTVKEVTISSIEKTPFTYLEESDEDSYTVDLTWTYTDTKTSSGYQTKATLTFVHEDKKLSLVELQ